MNKAGKVKYSLDDNRLKNGKGYIPKTVLGKKYTKQELIARMSSANNGSTTGQYEGFFRDLESTLGQIIQEGGSAMIGDFVRIKPVVKGSFERLAEPFNPRKHRIDVVATVTRAFVRDTTSEMTAERVEARHREVADLRAVNSALGTNILCPYYVNTILGSTLIPKGCILKGFTLSPLNRELSPFFIAEESIKISQERPKEILFCFSRHLNIPAELFQAGELSLNLDYIREETQMPLKSNAITVTLGEKE